MSHDRWFLDAIATRVFELDSDGLRSFEDGLGYYLDKRDELRRAARRDEAERRDDERRRRSGAGRGRRGRPRKRPARDSGRVRNPYAFARLEERIIELEEELAALREVIAAPEAWKDPALLKANQGREAALGAELAELYRRWEDWE
ncbi:MAG: hypothetical protein R3F30_08225 [Planctomycetota bacterium]